MSERDPLSPLSFSCVTEEVRKSQEELYRIYSEGERSALSPLAPDGRPLRRYVSVFSRSPIRNSSCFDRTARGFWGLMGLCGSS